MRNLLVLFLAALLAAYLIPTSVVAQTQFATITGLITDEQGLAVPEASVTVTNIATGTKQPSKTNKDGVYVVANVAPGEYEIAVEKRGFQKSVKRTTVEVAQALTQNFTLKVGPVTQTVSVTESTVAINVESAELSTTMTATQVANLPLATRNPYDLVVLSAGAADTGSVTGDTRGGNQATGEGLGVAVNGHRTSDINFMLNGAENNDTFVAGVGLLIPLDSIQEFKVQTSNYSAEFGRNPVVVNVTTKSGANAFHGDVWEYYRGSGISSSTFQAKAAGLPNPRYDRNDFGAALGGPILKDKSFFFGSFEGIRVRSAAPVTFYVPTADWLSNASTASQGFINAFGGNPASNCANSPITARFIVENIEGGGPGSYATSPLTSSNPATMGTPIPATTNLFCQDRLNSPTDSGGGFPQNDWRFTGKVDHHFSNQTGLTGYYAFQNVKLPPGAVSFSPFGNGLFNTSQRSRNQNANADLTHSFSPRLYSETRVAYNRTLFDQPEGGPGQAPTTTPCWAYGALSGFNVASPTGDLITFPGYVPTSCAFSGIPFGGPQNIYQANENMIFVKGKHTLKWGGGYLHLRDNRTFGAYENGFVDTESMQGMLDGTIDFAEIAINPNGKVPGNCYNPTSATVTCGIPPLPTRPDGPFTPPAFTRHFHYNELSFYGGDSWKVTSRFTLDLGIRWEYFGVLHSVGHERLLDANFYLGAVGPPNQTLFQSIANGRFSRTGQFYRPDYGDFGPRAGIAYDIFGNGRTVFRGGYGIFYDRNFGNAVFNSIQNPPNYAVATAGTFFGFPLTIDPNQFVSMAAGGPFTISSSARMLNRDLTTAYTEQWNGTIEHDILGKGVLASLAYVGGNGIHLYSLNNVNPRGGCLFDPTLNPSCVIDGSSSRKSRLNQTGVTNLNRRANEGFSRYHGLQFDLRTRQIGNTGVNVGANYTWSHSIDNESSFFADSAFEGPFGFGFRAPFNPGLDKASSSNDIRHRFTANAVWSIPWGKGMQGIGRQIFGGWALTSIIQAETGGAFSVYDGSASSFCTNNGTNFCYPVITGKVPAATSTPVAGTANTFNLYTFTGSTFATQSGFCSSPNITGFTGTSCTAVLYNLFPTLLSPRNLFRLPGLYNWDASVVKDFKLPREGMGLQLRLEVFNVLNHSNLYGVAATNSFSGPGSTVQASRGCFPTTVGRCAGGQERRNLQVAGKFTF